MDEDGLGGMTSNPAIFEKAITGSTDYADSLAELQQQQEPGRQSACTKAWRSATFRMRPTCCARSMTAPSGRDGYVSLEVSPFLANETQETIDEARRLWKAVNRPNLMIKIPGTPAGVPAIETVDQRRHQRQRHAAVLAGYV